ncbi:MAG: hypothetical protein JWQ38_3497 [Flavipsychrobacter sp.]|nr:hypothetical protein [Flavipsychrobacter sp.]
MSAIFGIIYKKYPVSMMADIVSMQHALKHRAIDGRAIWKWQQGFIGHHQFIVSPEQRHERQPYEDGNLVIAADASLHNRDELFSNLNIEKEQRSTYPDSLLILAAYKKWGNDFQNHLDGEYAFVIWDKEQHVLHAVTDHMGSRSLFYYDSPEMFVFASEMKGVLSVKKTPNVFNPESLIEYFFLQSDQSGTYNNEVFALCGGNKLTIDSKGLRKQQYWKPEKTGTYNFKKDADWAECLCELMIQAVENRMNTDLPVGISLSGGLDSSSIACIAGSILKKRNKPLYAFSSVLPAGHSGIELDERKYIKIVGDHISNLEQVYVAANDIGPFSGLELASDIEETFPNAFFYMDRAICEAAQAKNIRTFFSGYGGDFLVSHPGSTAIYQMVSDLKLTDAIELLQQFSSNEKRPFLRILKKEVIAHTGAFKLFSSIKHRKRVNWLHYTPLEDTFVNGYKGQLDFSDTIDNSLFMAGYIASGYVSRTMGKFANRNERFGMRCELPLFDRKINEFMLNVPVKQFVVGGVKRSLVRRAMEGILPKEIQWRKDKLAYSPDYINRILKNKQFVNKIIHSDSDTFVSKYIDKNKIVSNIDGLKPIAGVTKPHEIAGIRIIQGVIACVFLQLLKDNKYIFSE